MIRVLAFVILALCLCTRCDTLQIVPSGQIPPGFIDGFVDKERGVLISIREPIPIDEPYNIDTLLLDSISNVELQICNSKVDKACTRIPQVKPGLWRLHSLPDYLGSSLSVKVELKGNLYEASGSLPETTAVSYDSIATVFIPEALDVRDIYDDALKHDYTLRTSDANLSVLIVYPELYGQTSAGTYATSDGSQCNIFNFARGYDAILPGCKLEDAVQLSTYQYSEASDTLRFFVTSTYEEGYVYFLEALRQDNYNSGIGGLYDVLEVEGNVPGLGGYILFSNSQEVIAVSSM